jgi:hypothetical protein
MGRNGLYGITVWGVLLLASNTPAKSKTAAHVKPPGPGLQQSQFTLLKRNKGAFSDDLRETTLRIRETWVLKSLADRKIRITPEVMAWVHSNEFARQALFGSMIDPNALLNLDVLWQELGRDFVELHSHLVIAAAVMRRETGLGPIATANNRLKMVNVAGHAHSLEKAGENIEQGLARQRERSEEQLDAARKLNAYLKKNRLLPREAYADPGHSAQMEAIIAKFNQDTSRANRLALLNVLYDAQALRKERPLDRDGCPPVADFLRYLEKLNAMPV